MIEKEDVAIAVNTPAEVNAHLNNLLNKSVGVDNLATGIVDATENWWGCDGGPGTPGCASAKGPNVIFAPWLTTPVQGGRGREHTDEK